MNNIISNPLNNPLDEAPKKSYWKIVFFIGGLILLAMYLYVNLVDVWQETLLKNVQENVAIKPETKPKTKAEIKKSDEVLKEKQLIQSMAFSQIPLPDLPEAAKVQSSKDSAQSTPQKIVLNKGNTKDEKVIKARESQVERDVASTVESKTESNKLAQQVNSKPSKVIGEQTAQVYHQLISDQSLSIEIAWPEQSNAREKLFNYLYQCADVRFGVLNQQGVTLAKQTSQNSSRTYRSKQHIQHKTQHSEWLRIAQGSLGQNEQKWLTQYQLSGTPIRLFPKYIDWQLANLIAEHLAGKVDSQGRALSLSHLRAKYKLKGQRLILDNISINNQSLNQSWLLVETTCSA